MVILVAADGSLAPSKNLAHLASTPECCSRPPTFLIWESFSYKNCHVRKLLTSSEKIVRKNLSSEKIMRKNLSSEKLLSRIRHLNRPNKNNTLSEKILSKICHQRRPNKYQSFVIWEEFVICSKKKTSSDAKKSSSDKIVRRFIVIWEDREKNCHLRKLLTRKLSCEKLSQMTILNVIRKQA